MVSLSPNLSAQDFYIVDPMKMGHPGLNSVPNPVQDMSMTENEDMSTGFFSEDPNKKVRKPYTITKSRESWTEQEHDKFLEALQLFDRDWKKIEAFVGSKTVIQIRSHAQKYFMKVQKNGTNERVPPPRPKRKAAHPYPQKAPKNVTGPFQYSGALLEPAGSVLMLDSLSDSLSAPGNPIRQADDVGLTGQIMPHNCCSSSNESTPRSWPTGETNNQENGKQNKPMRVMPDFAQVYSFIGSVFDPNENDHLQKLMKMDTINVETVVLLMKSLSVNLTSPEFKSHQRLLSSYDVDSSTKLDNLHADKLGNAIPTM